MLHVRMHEHGGPEVLGIASTSRPEPAAGQLRLRVEAASVNYADVMRRRGAGYPFPTPLPFTPGSEVAGTVDALGPGVDGPPVGTPVFAFAGVGEAAASTGYAQYALADAAQVLPIPPGVTPATACAVLVAGTTASLVLREVAVLREGERVFVPAAAGGVGSVAVQLARAYGAARVIAGVGSASKRDTAIAFGADDAIVYDDATWPDAVRAATGGRGVDVLLEMRGGDALAAGMRALAPHGRAVVYGMASHMPATLDAATVHAWLHAPALNQSVSAFNLGAWFAFRPDRAGAAIGDVVARIAQGTLRMPSIDVLPLAAAADAHRRLEARETIGKLVLDPWR